MLKLNIETSLFILIVSVANVVTSSSASENATKILNELMKKPYDRRVRPLQGENPLFVRASLNIESIFKVDEQNGEISVRITLRQEWLEPRLTFPLGMTINDTLHLGRDQGKLLWVPDTVPGNIRKYEKLDTHDVTLLNAEGLVTASNTFLLTLGCPMILRTYPFDVQTCLITFFSQSFSQEELIYELQAEDSSVELDPENSIGRYKFFAYQMKRTFSKNRQGMSTVLAIKLHFQGLWKTYLTSIYVPLLLQSAFAVSSNWFMNAKYGLIFNIFNMVVLNLYTRRSGASGINIHGTAIEQYFYVSFAFVLASLFIQLLRYSQVKSSKKENCEAEDHSSSINEVEQGKLANEDEQQFRKTNSLAVSTPLKVVEEDPENGIPLEEQNAQSDEQQSQKSFQSTSRFQLRTDQIFASLLSKGSLTLNWFYTKATWIILIAYLSVNLIYFGIYLILQVTEIEQIQRSIQRS